MTKQRINPANDEDAQELDAEWFQQARPAHEVLPNIFGKEPAQEMLKPKGCRQKADSTKVPVTIRLSLEVVSHFKSTGKGWQTRMDEALKQYVHKNK